MQTRAEKILLLALALTNGFGTTIHAEPGTEVGRVSLASEKSQTLGQIVGFVTDRQGSFVSHASVALLNPSTEFNQQIATDGRGYFEVGLMEPGEYRLTGSAPGFVEVIKDVSIGLGQVVHADIMTELATT